MDRPDEVSAETRTHTTYHRDTDTRWAHRNLGGWWWLALLGLPLLLAALVAGVRGGTMENDLSARSAAALDKAGISGVQLDFDGRDATLKAAAGATLSKADLDRAQSLVADVEGVRVADIDASGLAADGSTEPTPAEESSSAPAPACDAAEIQGQIDGVLGADKLVFGEGSAKVAGASADQVTKVAGLLTGCDLTVTVSGHTDVFGAKGKLSQARADSVKQALVAAGISADLITAEGRGDADPLGDNNTAAGRDRNRYADITVQ